MFVRSDPQLKSRYDFGRFAAEQGLLGAAVEVGVNKGAWAVRFLDQWPGERMYLVDPWRQLPADEYVDSVNTKDDGAERFLECEKRLKAHVKRVECFRGLSADAAAQLPDGLDFVHIDANHAYEHASRDLQLWWPKLRSGGILAGHDLFSNAHMGVTNAVVDFFYGKHEIHVVPLERDNKGRIFSAASFWVWKP